MEYKGFNFHYFSTFLQLISTLAPNRKATSSMEMFQSTPKSLLPTVFPGTGAS